jgi:NADH-quinone oxidoreductase subunit D
LAAITGLDLGPEANRIEVLYHFCEGPVIATLRVHLPRRGGIVPSLYADYPAASFFERELFEMYGVVVNGTPDTSRLFIPDDFPDGVYPMLKDYDPSRVKTLRAEASPAAAIPPEGATPPGRFIIPIGPQHPALKEPGHFEFGVDGEIVTSAKMRLGYVHRGIEKACEEQNWIQDLYLLERICGICSHSHSTAYALGVEKLAQVEVSPRAQAIREVFAGLERIHSHMLWLGVAAHEAGFDTLFMYSWRDRETVMDILEQVGGNRVNYSISVLGGVKQDIKPQDAEVIRKGMQFLEERANRYLDVVTSDRMFLQRTRGIGHMTKAQAEFLGILGPTARASGVLRDIRIEAPYGLYSRFPVSLVSEDAGDLEARFKVRLREIIVSTHAIRTILDNLPEGELAVRVPRRVPAGEAISRVEAPRGELFYYIKSNGSDKPERIKVRTPSLCNWTYVLISAIGRQLADVPLLLAGMDPCFSCNDR